MTGSSASMAGATHGARLRLRALGVLPFACTIGGGILLRTAYPPFSGGSGTVFLALVPLLVSCRLLPPRRAGAVAFVGMGAFWVSALSWFLPLAGNGGPLALVLLGMAGLGAWCALFSALFAVAFSRYWAPWRKLRAEAKAVRVRLVEAPEGSAEEDECVERLAAIVRRCARFEMAGPFVAAVFWAGSECLRSRIGGGFSWYGLSSGVATMPALLQVSSLGGAFLVSALVVLLSDALAGTFLRSWSIMTHVPGATRRHLELTAALVVLLVAFSFGLGRIRSIRAAEESATARHLRVAAVDPSQPCIFADNGDEWDAAVERMFSLCFMAAAARPDFVALPETSLWETMPSPRLERSLADFSSQLGAPILAGGTLVQDGSPNAALQPVKNAYWMFSPDGISKPYVKRHLVPFGEFIPLDETFPFLQKLSPVGITCTPGTAPVHFHCNGFNISPLICFEDTDSPTVRSAAKGADLLLSASNDAWFDGSCEAEQHHREASIRAVETGVPLLRVSNRGIGGVFSPTGAKTPDGGAVFVHPVPIPDARLMPPNVYMRFGDWVFGYPCAAVLALTVLFRRGFGKRRFWREKRL